jgi:hypothetical protein
MRYLANARAKQLQEHSNFPHAGVYDPPGVGGTGVMYVLHDMTQTEAYGGLPSDPHIPWSVKLWKHPLKWLGNVAMVGGLLGLFVHYIRFGPKDDPDDPTANQNEPPVSGLPIKERPASAPPVTTSGERVR